ncbi:MAG: NAD(P)H-dependent oxidoreductase [Schaedlerella sp.]|nr:NAD(P)H-dependent oxidoreductase [Lachnospiraceae bacterium]MDY4202850.1 NAD(P)H-dependent oxidoreductase [Schaedlerella sp.]
MKILVINGSPRGEHSNSMKLTRAFLEGIGSAEVKERIVSKMNISPCKGCFCCWNKTPGKCIMSDDMVSVIEDQLWADIIIWSFPLYYFNVPGGLKTLIDRQLPMVLPFMTDAEENVGSGSHQARYDMSGKQHILISTCGFYSADGNYDSVKSMFDHICGRGKYETIFCGQGELFRIPELKKRTDEYLSLVKKAGNEYVDGGISAETKNALSELLYSKEVFEEMADASWGIDKENGGKADEQLAFTRQMAALYRKSSYDGKERVLEICYTDLGKTYQVLMGKDGSKVYTDGSLKATTRIDTPWDVWLSVARGEMRGDEALAKGLYKVSGDFSLMIRWDDFFGGTSDKEPKDEIEKIPEKKKPVMLTMLIAWITFWVAVSLDTKAGAVITMAVCAALPLIMAKRELTIYDRISICAASVLSAFAMMSGLKNMALVAGYLGFGLLWLLSCFTGEPVCAAYVKYNYYGDDALNNPIFMKTNYILAAGWGILYIMISIWSWFLLSADRTILLQIVNNGATITMGIFTAWFERWYPAHMASGGSRR